MQKLLHFRCVCSTTFSSFVRVYIAPALSPNMLSSLSLSPRSQNVFPLPPARLRCRSSSCSLCFNLLPCPPSCNPTRGEVALRELLATGRQRCRRGRTWQWWLPCRAMADLLDVSSSPWSSDVYVDALIQWRNSGLDRTHPGRQRGLYLAGEARPLTHGCHSDFV